MFLLLMVLPLMLVLLLVVVVLDVVVVGAVVAVATSDNCVVACFGLDGPSDGTSVVDVVVGGGASDDTGVVAGFGFGALLLLHLAATSPFLSFQPK